MSGWVPDPDTLFEGIYKLEPGHYLTVTREATRKHRYWDFELIPDESETGWQLRLESALDTSIRRQLRSDVPVGFFMSGGVDSSLLVAKAIGAGIHPTTYTIGFRWANSSVGREFDLDLQAARRMKSEFPLDYQELILEPSIVSTLPLVVDSLEEPLAIPRQSAVISSARRRLLGLRC